MSVEYLNELKTHWKIYSESSYDLNLYGITKDPETKEFMMIMKYAEIGSLRHVLSSNFKNILWKEKIYDLFRILRDLKLLHELGYFHKDFHSGNILQTRYEGTTTSISYVVDFGLSGPSNNQKSDGNICGVLPYIAPEVLNGQAYTFSSDIYSVGIIMTELSSGKPPFHNRKHDASLALAICKGLRPEFGKGTPEIYKKLAYRCMDASPDKRPTVQEVFEMVNFWDNNIKSSYVDKFGYKGREIQTIFKEADKEIPNISTPYKKDPDATYTSRAFTFSNLPNPINSSIITSYINGDVQDSQLLDLQLNDIDDDN